MWGTIWNKKNSKFENDLEDIKLPKKYFLIGGLLVVIALISSGLALYFYQKSGNSQDNSGVVREESTNLVNEVSKLIVLPDDEQPTIATVADPEKLKDQPFFRKAQKGFKVLIYTNARKAVLYSPSLDKIVEIAPLNIGQ